MARTTSVPTPQTGSDPGNSSRFDDNGVMVWFCKSFPAEGEARDEISSSSFVVLVSRCWSAGADPCDSEKNFAGLFFYIGTSQVE